MIVASTSCGDSGVDNEFVEALACPADEVVAELLGQTLSAPGREEIVEGGVRRYSKDCVYDTDAYRVVIVRAKNNANAVATLKPVRRTQEEPWILTTTSQ